MPQGLKDILKQQARMPGTLAKGTPLAQPLDMLAGALSQVADALPEIPMPALPGMPAAAAAPGLPQIQDLVKGIEAALPQGFPKLGQMAPGGGGGEAPRGQATSNPGNPYPKRQVRGVAGALMSTSQVPPLAVKRAKLHFAP